MSALVIELAVMEAVEETAEIAAEQGIESLIEVQITSFLEISAEEMLEVNLEVVVNDGVEVAVEDVAEEAAENAAEENLELAAAEAQTGTWTQMFWDKIFPAMIAGVSAGLVIEVVERSVDAALGKHDKDEDEDEDEDEDNENITATSDPALETVPDGIALFSVGTAASPQSKEEKLQASKKLLSCLDQVTKRWEAELGKYKDKNDAFGSYKYKTQWQNANTTVAVLLTNMKKDLDAASALAEKSNEESSWDKNMTEFQWYLIDAAGRLLAVYRVKSLSQNMQNLAFPPEADEKFLQSELEKAFPDYQSIIKEMVNKHLGNAVEGTSKTATADAIKKVIKPPLKKEMNKGFDAEIRPMALEEGKKAAKAEVTAVFNEWAARINQHAAIPIYGVSTLKSWMEANIEPEAERRAEEKALAAAKATMELPDAQLKMMKITDAAKKKVLNDYKDAIDKAAADAARKAIDDALNQYTAKK